MKATTKYFGYTLETHFNIDCAKLYIIRKQGEFITSFKHLAKAEQFIKNNR